MIVMKFGGSSVADASSIERVVNIIRGYLPQHPVIVVSAMSKTTRKLLRAAELAAGGDLAAGTTQLEELKAYHMEVIRGLRATAVESEVDGYFNEIERLLSGLAILREFTPRGRDRIAAYGELISSKILVEALRRAGVNARWLDARQFIITDDDHTRARPLFDMANPKIVHALRPCLEAGQIPVTQGYIGSTIDGITTTLGFEGSDYTAAIIGAALDAQDIQIWTDVNGIMTADPALLPEARTVKILSFAEAKELTHFGAKVLHPKTLFPAHEKAIPVHIYNSKQPDAPGTVIALEAPPARTPVKSLAYKKPISLVTIISNGSLPRLRFFKLVFDALERAGLFAYIAAISELRVALAVDPSEMTQALINQLQHAAQTMVTHNHAIVCLVGERLKQRPGIVADVFQALNDMRFDLISQGASEHSLALIVHEANLETALKRLHELLFQNPDPALFY